MGSSRTRANCKFANAPAPLDFLVAKTGGEPLLGRYGKKGTGDLGWTFLSGHR